MEKIKKNLLVFFGEYRTFEHIIPQLEHLDKVDIIFSTWSISYITETNHDVNTDKILSILPNIKQIYVTDPYPYLEKHASWKMYWHWKNVINNIQNHEEYENVILHRCDMISEWHTLLDLEIEHDTVYLEADNLDTISYIDKHSGIWINDYCFFGKFDIMKKFINSFDKSNYEVPHFPIYTTLIENNINFKHYYVKKYLIRDYHVEYMKYLNSNNIHFFDLQKESKLYKKFYQIMYDSIENEKNRLNLENRK
jgi:hypothetical protein